MHDLHVSNLLTYVSLAAAVGAIAAASSGRSLPLAGACLALAALSDTFDGAFARRFSRTSRQQRVGGELDSLVDAIAFGLAPVSVLAMLPAQATGMLAIGWWIGAGAYVAAAVTRLAFYNVEQDGARFVGLPTPASALLWSTLLFVSPPSWAVAVAFVVMAIAMVAPLPISRPRGMALGAFAAWAVLLVGCHVLQWVAV